MPSEMGSLLFSEDSISSEYAQNDALSGMIIRQDGSIVLAGFTNGTIDGHSVSGASDGYIVQVDSDGKMESVSLVGTSKEDYLYALTSNKYVIGEGSDNNNDDLIDEVFVGGCTDGTFGSSSNMGSFDIWLGCFSLKEKKFAWKSMLGSTSFDWLYSMDVIEDAKMANTFNVAAGGVTLGDLKVSKGGHDAWFGLFSASTGELKWKKQIGTPQNEWLYKLICDPVSKHILVGGVTKGELVAGSRGGSSDVWVGRYDQDGTKQWLVQLGTSELDSLQSMTLDSKGNLFIGGFTAGVFTSYIPGDTSSGVSSFVAQLDMNNGGVVWLEQYPSEAGFEDNLKVLTYDPSRDALYAGGNSEPSVVSVESTRRRRRRTRRRRRQLSQHAPTYFHGNKHLDQSNPQSNLAMSSVRHHSSSIYSHHMNMNSYSLKHEKRHKKTIYRDSDLLARSTASSTNAMTIQPFKHQRQNSQISWNGRRKSKVNNFKHRQLFSNELDSENNETDSNIEFGYWIAEIDMQSKERKWIERMVSPSLHSIELTAMSINSNSKVNEFGINDQSSSFSDPLFSLKLAIGGNLHLPTVPVEGYTVSNVWYAEYQLPSLPTFQPTPKPSLHPSLKPTPKPSFQPIPAPTFHPTFKPTSQPSSHPIPAPTTPDPTHGPTFKPSFNPSSSPSSLPTPAPQKYFHHNISDNYFPGLSNVDFYSILATLFGIILLICSWKLQRKYASSKRKNGYCIGSSSANQFQDEYELASLNDSYKRARKDSYDHSANEPENPSSPSSPPSSSSLTNFLFRRQISSPTSHSQGSSKYRFTSAQSDRTNNEDESEEEEEEEDPRKGLIHTNHSPPSHFDHHTVEGGVIQIEPHFSSLLPTPYTQPTSPSSFVGGGSPSHQQSFSSQPFELEYETETDTEDDGV